MPFQKGHKYAPGGSRPGAGRKPQAATIARRDFLDQACPHAEAFIVAVLRGDIEDVEERGRMARWVIEQRDGKAKQRHDINASVGFYKVLGENAGAFIDRLRADFGVGGSQ